MGTARATTAFAASPQASATMPCVGERREDDKAGDAAEREAPRRRCRSCRAPRARSRRAPRAAARTPRAREWRGRGRRRGARGAGRSPVIRSPSGPRTRRRAPRPVAPGRGSEREGAALRAEPSLGGRAREVGDDDHPEGLRGEHEDEVDAVGAEEAVGLGGPPELLREQRARPRRRDREHDLREARASAPLRTRAGVFGECCEFTREPSVTDATLGGCAC